MIMSLRRSRWLLVVAVLAAWWTAAVVGRPTDFDDAADESPNKDDGGAPFTGTPNVHRTNTIDEALCSRLATMTDRELGTLEAGLATIGAGVPAGMSGDTGDNGEMMMGDMPSADETSQDQSSSVTAAAAQVTVRNEALFAERERSKKRRIQAIQNQLMEYMGRLPSSPLSNTHPILPIQSNANKTTAVKKMLDTVTNLLAYPSDVTRNADTAVEKVQSFFPICSEPKNTNDEDGRYSQKAMNLMFSISLPRSSGGGSVNINMTKLRLYKHLISCTSQSSVESDDSQICQPLSSKKNSKLANSSSAEGASSAEDKQIRVSVYIRLMKKKVSMRNRLLDSRMLSYYDEKWTEWNIHKAFKTWRNQTHNFTITIIVEDEDGNFLPVTRFFKPMNCTVPEQTTNSKPIPGLVMESVHKGLQNGDVPSLVPMTPQMALSLNLPRYPIVDVTTVEVPAAEQMQLFSQYTVAAATATTPSSGWPDIEHTTHTRIRHANSRTTTAANPTDAVPPTSSLQLPTAADISMIGEQLRKSMVNTIVLGKFKNTTETPKSRTASSS